MRSETNTVLANQLLNFRKGGVALGKGPFWDALWCFKSDKSFDACKA